MNEGFALFTLFLIILVLTVLIYYATLKVKEFCDKFIDAIEKSFGEIEKKFNYELDEPFRVLQNNLNNIWKMLLVVFGGTIFQILLLFILLKLMSSLIEVGTQLANVVSNTYNIELKQTRELFYFFGNFVLPVLIGVFLIFLGVFKFLIKFIVLVAKLFNYSNGRIRRR
jgi:uncharacterized integral membrane protein